MTTEGQPMTGETIKVKEVGNICRKLSNTVEAKEEVGRQSSTRAFAMAERKKSRKFKDTQAKQLLSSKKIWLV